MDPHALRALLEPLALDYHKVQEGEYGCPGLSCPGVQRLIRLGERLAEALEARPAPLPDQLGSKLPDVTDLETLKAILTRAGIPFTEEPYDGSPYIPAVSTLRVEANSAIAGIPLDAELARRETAGYTCFYTDFYFDAAESLVNMGAYE